MKLNRTLSWSEELFPLARLDDAVGSVCMGLVLRDGSTVYGDARPRACR